MLWLVWIGLGIAVVATAVGVYRSVRGALGVFRALGDLQRGAGAAAASLADAAERLAARPDPSGELAPALARFNRSRAQLAVLVAAVQDVRDTIGLVTAFYPRK